MKNRNLLLIGRRATIGVITLTGQTAVLQIVTFVATFLLTVVLNPTVFGIFFVVSGVVSFFNYFSDIGLAAALVQKKESLTTADLKTTFTIQSILVISLVVGALFLSPSVAHFRGLPPEGLLLLQALIISFFLSSLKTIPSILLERELRFHKLAIPQIVETLVFYITAVFLAYSGMGLTSFAIAVLLRGISGVIVIYMIQPWKLSFGIEKKAAKKLLQFGLPFQTNSILAFIKDDLFTVIILPSFLPFTDIGFIGWAKKWAEAPLRLVMDNIIRVTFPAYSRLQHDSLALSKAIEKAVFFLSLIIFPLVLCILFFTSPLLEFIISIIPSYAKWKPGLLSLYFFSLATIFSSISSPLINALNAIGRISTTLIFMIIWTILTWTLIPLLLIFLGYNGVAVGSLAISCSVILVIMTAKRSISFSLRSSFKKPLFLTALMLVYLITSYQFFNLFSPLMQLLIFGSGAFIVYIGGLFLIVRKEVASLIRNIHHDHS